MDIQSNSGVSSYLTARDSESYTLAIDLGGPVIKIGLLKEGRLLDRKELAVQSSAGLIAHLRPIEELINRMLQEFRCRPEEIMGIGLAFAGLVDSVSNRILSTNKKYDDGPETDLTGWARRVWNCPLYALNDARMALLGEWQYGAGQGCDNLVMVTLGTGIGSAVLFEGKLLVGKHFQAGNLGGHFVVNHQGTACTCGGVGCVEAEASTWRLPSLLKDHPGFGESAMAKEKIPDFGALFKHAEKNDPVARNILDHCLSAWAAGIINMIHAFDPEKIVLGGGLMKSSAVILPALQKKVDQNAWTPWGKVKLVEARFPDSAALYGADFLVRSKMNFK